MTSILKLFLGVLLRFLWDRAEEWYQQELAYQRNKRILIDEVKAIAREVADSGDQLRIDRESVNDSLLRLERIAFKRERSPVRIDGPVFGDAYRVGAEGNSSDYPEHLPGVSGAETGGDPSDS